MGGARRVENDCLSLSANDRSIAAFTMAGHALVHWFLFAGALLVGGDRFAGTAEPLEANADD